jgi:hypothetical protein
MLQLAGLIAHPGIDSLYLPLRMARSLIRMFWRVGSPTSLLSMMLAVPSWSPVVPGLAAQPLSPSRRSKRLKESRSAMLHMLCAWRIHTACPTTHSGRHCAPTIRSQCRISSCCAEKRIGKADNHYDTVVSLAALSPRCRSTRKKATSFPSRGSYASRSA